MKKQFIDYRLDGYLTVYIASSWKNSHGVELLTKQLREMGCIVLSWVENNFGENHNHVTKKMDFESWVNSPESDQSFNFDTGAAMCCEMFIYYSPAGNDASAELGAAFASEDCKYTVGLWTKNEPLGLMRKMVSKWFSRPSDLLIAVYNTMAENGYIIKKAPEGIELDE